MPINPVRIEKDLAAIAACTETPGEGATRPTFSLAWRQATDYVRDELLKLDCTVWMDAAGNLHARAPGVSRETPVWGSGSHLDSVPRGGDYDGVMGVVIALEVFRAAREDGKSTLPLELIVFAEEEGPTFGLGMLGSRAWVGEIGKEELRQLRNAGGLTYLEAGEPHGVVPHRLETERIDPTTLRGFVEVHAEQGPGMWKNQIAVALVTGIAGRFQYRVTYQGTANHAGSTAMEDRFDAMAGAAEAICGLEKMVRELSPQAVLTVGHLTVLPNAINVIAEKVELTIDFRAPEEEVLEEGQRRIRDLLREVGKKRGLTLTLEQTEAIPAVILNTDLAQRLETVAIPLVGQPLPRTFSGALHDSAVLAPFVPTMMLFVASRDGISHNPGEYSRLEDITLAAEILANFLDENRSQ